MIAVGVMPHPQHAMLGPAPTVVSSGPGIAGTTNAVAAPGVMMASPQQQHHHQALAQVHGQALGAPQNLPIPSAAVATAMQQPQVNVPQVAQHTRRYVPYKVLGQGAFGTVICAKDVQTNNMVAVKKIQHIFDNALATRRVLREIKLLRALDHPNIVSCSDVLYPRNSLYTKDDGSGGSGGGGSFALAGGVQGGGGMVQVPGGSPPSTSHQEIQPNMPHPNGGGPVNPRNPIANPKLDRVYLVTEFVDTDLHRVIRSNQVLTPKHVQYFMFQAFCALDYLHRRNVLHRDMKPSNLLVKKNCELKICDFGLARVDKNPVYSQDALDPPLAVGMTEHVATRWYRAPEVILSNGMYGKAMDVWGLGCIFAELIARKPLFPGKHYLDQLTLIIDQIGAPAETEIAVFESEKARTFLRSLAHKTKKPLSAALPGADPLALDLLEQTLIFDAHKRITAAKALQHPYFKALYPSRAREISTPVAPVPPFAFDDVQNNGDSGGSGGSGQVTNYQPQVTPDQWRAMVAEEVADFYRHRKAKEAAAAAAAAAAQGATPSTGSVASSVVSYSPGNSASGSPHSVKASPAIGAAPMVAHHDPHHPQAAQYYTAQPAQPGYVTGQPMYAAAQQPGVPAGAQPYYAPHPPAAGQYPPGAYPYQPGDEKRVPAPMPNPAYAAAAAGAVLVSASSPHGQVPPGADGGAGLAAVGSGSATARGTGANSPLRVSSSPAGGVSTNHKHMEPGPFGGIGTPTRVDSPGNVDSPMRRGELGSDNSLNDSGAQTINNSTPVRPNHPPQGYSGSPRSSLRHANDGRSSPGRTGTSSPKRVKSLRQHHYHMRAAAIKHHTAAAAAAAHNTGQMSPITGGATESPRLLPPPNAGGSPKQQETKTLQPVYQSLLAQQQAAAAASQSLSQSQPLPAGTTVVSQVSPPPGLVSAAGAAGAAVAAGANARPVPRTAFAAQTDSQQQAKTPPNAARGLARTGTGAGLDLNAPSLVQTQAALSTGVAPALQPSTSPQHRSVPEGPGHSKNPSLSQSRDGSRKPSRDSPQSLSSSNPLAAAAQAAADELEATHAAAASARPSSSESRLRAQRARSNSSSGAVGMHPQDAPVGVHNVSQSYSSLPAVGSASPVHAPQTQPYSHSPPQVQGTDVRPPSSHGSTAAAGATGATGSTAPGARPLSGRRAKPANPVATAGAIAAVNNAAASASAVSGGVSGSHSRKTSVESNPAVTGAGGAASGNARRSSNSGLGGAAQSNSSLPRFASPTASSARAAASPAQVQRQPSGSSRSSAASQGFTDALTAATDKQSARSNTNSPATVARRNSGSSNTAGAAAAASAASNNKGSTNSPPVMPVQAAVLASPTGPVTAPVVVGGLPSRRPSNTSSPSVTTAGAAAGARSSPRLSPPQNPQVAPATDTPPKPAVTISTTAAATDSPTAGGASSPANAAGGNSLFPPSAKPVRSSPISKMSRRPDGGDGTSSPVHGSRNMSASLFAAAGAASLNGGTAVKPQSGGGTGTGFYASSTSAFSTANAGAAAASTGAAAGAGAAKGAPLPLGNAAGASLSTTGPMSGRNRLPALQK